MPRRPRIQAPDLIRHVVARGNGRMCIFLDDLDYQQFVHFLTDAIEESETCCWNYCVMPNHYHLTVQPTLPNLSETIQQLNSEYAQWWNRRHGRVGHVFQGRFKDQVVDRDSYLLVLSRYVVMNPVRAGLVHQPEDWRWSSYRATAGLVVTPPFLSVSSTLHLFGGVSDATRRRKFEEFVRAPVADQAPVDRIRTGERVLGSKEFKTLVRNRRD